MAKKKGAPSFECTECGWQTVKWVGRCPECQAWGTVEEKGQVTARTTAASNLAQPAEAIHDVDSSVASFRATSIGELDRVLGGGLVPGAVILMARGARRREVHAAAPGGLLRGQSPPGAAGAVSDR